MSAGPIRILGRYALYDEIAAGGMATVHWGRLMGPVGFSRTVAIKRLHPQFAKDAEFATMFLDEARVAARIQHPNVVSTLDVVALENELFLVMEYVEGESLARLSRSHSAKGERIPLKIVGSIVTSLLYGLHAAHEATSERGEPLGIIHRDVSPQNVLVGVDGTTRVLDFGVAKAAGRVQTTREGQIKGKLAYMPIEQITGEAVDRRVDVYAASVVLWEALTGKRLLNGESEASLLFQVMNTKPSPPSELVPGISPELDAVVLKGLARDPADRWPTAFDMAVAVEETLGTDPPRRVAALVRAVAAEDLEKRARTVKEIESHSGTISLDGPPGPADAVRDQAPPAAPAAARPTSEDSSLSKVSSASLNAVPKVPSRRAKWPIVALALGACALAGFLLLRPPAASPSRAPSAGPATVAAGDLLTSDPAGAASGLPRAASSEVIAPTGEPSVVSAPSVAPLATPPGSQSHTAHATAVAVPKVPTATAVKPPTTAPASKEVKPGCATPYHFENGVKKYKPECF